MYLQGPNHSPSPSFLWDGFLCNSFKILCKFLGRTLQSQKFNQTPNCLDERGKTFSRLVRNRAWQPYPLLLFAPHLPPAHKRHHYLASRGQHSLPCVLWETNEAKHSNTDIFEFNTIQACRAQAQQLKEAWICNKEYCSMHKVPCNPQTYHTQLLLDPNILIPTQTQIGHPFPELTHVTTRVAAHPMTPPPLLCVMVAQPAQVTQVTPPPLILVHEPLRTVPRHSPGGGPVTRHSPSPPLHGWVSSPDAPFPMTAFGPHICIPTTPTVLNCTARLHRAHGV